MMPRTPARARAGPFLLLALFPVLAAAGCAHSAFDATLRQGSVEEVLAAFAEEDARGRPDAILQVALLLRERGTAEDAAVARGLLEELVRERPETPEARAARALIRLDRELDAAGASVAALAERVRAGEAEVAEGEARVRELEREMALRDSLVNVLTRTASRLESELETRRRELVELRETLELIMEVDLEIPPVPASEPASPSDEPET